MARGEDTAHHPGRKVGYNEVALPNPSNPGSSRFALMGFNYNHLPQHSGPSNYTSAAFDKES